MKLQLIMTEPPVLVSDEEIKEGDMKYYSINNATYIHNKDMALTKDHFKVIAGLPDLPSIEFSDEAAKTLQERCGWVDVEKVIKDYVQELIECNSVKEYERTHISAICHTMYFKLQSINQNRFSEEDVRKAIAMGQSEEWDEGGYLGHSYKPDEILQHLKRPKCFEVEVEMTAEIQEDDKVHGYINKENNSIKVTKIND